MKMDAQPSAKSRICHHSSGRRLGVGALMPETPSRGGAPLVVDGTLTSSERHAPRPTTAAVFCWKFAVTQLPEQARQLLGKRLTGQRIACSQSGGLKKVELKLNSYLKKAPHPCSHPSVLKRNLESMVHISRRCKAWVTSTLPVAAPNAVETIAAFVKLRLVGRSSHNRSGRACIGDQKIRLRRIPMKNQ